MHFDERIALHEVSSCTGGDQCTCHAEQQCSTLENTVIHGESAQLVNSCKTRQRAFCSAVSMKLRAPSDSQLGYAGLRYMMHS